MFDNRKDAGVKLAEALKKYQTDDPLVLAIPKGGIEVAVQIVRKFNCDFSMLVSRKLPWPDNPETGFGAVTEDGTTFFVNTLKKILSPFTVNKIIETQKNEIKRRIEFLRFGAPLPELKDRTVILVDDGIAMGATMRVSIKFCQKQNPQKLVVAAPVASADMVEELNGVVDDVVILETPFRFHAVAQVYREWHDVSDKEAVKLLDK